MKKTIFFIVFLSIFSIVSAQTKPKNVEETVKRLFGKLEEKALSNGVNKPKLKLGIEFIRTEKSTQRILIKKSEYPLTDMKTTLFDPKNFKLSFYEGKISIPLEFYSNDKKDLALKSKKIQNAKITIELMVVPINKIGSKYVFFARTGESYENFDHFSHDGKKSSSNYIGMMVSKNEIALNLGESIKLDINTFSFEEWYVEDNIEGQKVRFESKKDYFDCFDDYLILTLESEG